MTYVATDLSGNTMSLGGFNLNKITNRFKRRYGHYPILIFTKDEWDKATKRVK